MPRWPVIRRRSVVNGRRVVYVGSWIVRIGSVVVVSVVISSVMPSIAMSPVMVTSPAIVMSSGVVMSPFEMMTLSMTSVVPVSISCQARSGGGKDKSDDYQ